MMNDAQKSKLDTYAVGRMTGGYETYAETATETKMPDGAFTDIRNAMNRLYEASAAVERLAASLVGQDVTVGEEPLEKSRCGGQLGELSATADSIRSTASRIIENIERIERHAD